MKLKQFIYDTWRLRKILAAAYEVGLGLYLSKTSLAWWVPLHCRIKCYIQQKQCTPVELPQRIRHLLEDLGPTFIKLGQILSMRPDFLPPQYIQEFQKLQEHASEISFEIISGIIHSELGKISDHYKEFNKEPLATASLGQVYEAYLHDGTRVAVKIQKPNIQKSIESDLRILCHLAKQLEKHFVILSSYRPAHAMEMVRETLLKELDYLNEGRNAERFAYNFKAEKGVKVPQIYWQHSTSKVLTMEFIEGIRMGDMEKLSAAGLNHERIMKNCTRACLLPPLSYGFFHADPHPGNVLALADERICYLDFGMVGQISPKLRHQLLLVLLYFVNEEIEAMVRALMNMLEAGNQPDFESYQEYMTSSLVHFFLHDQGAESMTQMLYEIISAASRYQVIFPGGMTMLIKAMVTGEAMCRMTHKDLDYIKASKSVIEEIYSNEFGLKHLLQHYQKFLPFLLERIKELPEHWET